MTIQEANVGTGEGGSHSFCIGSVGSGGSKEAKPPCAFCNRNHGIWNCRQFQNMGVKWEVVMLNRR